MQKMRNPLTAALSLLQTNKMKCPFLKKRGRGILMLRKEEKRN